MTRVDEQEREQFHRNVRTMHDEGQGVWRMSALSPATALAVLSEAAAGDKDAASLLRAAADALRQMATAPAERRWLCLTCDHAFSRKAQPIAIVFFHAQRDEPKQAICNGICAECYDRNPGDELLPHAMKAYQKLMIPDLRELPPFSAPGRA